MAKPVDSFKNRLETALAYRDMIPAELSRRTGLTEATISHYRSGYSKAKSDKLLLIAETLNVSPTWLAGYDVPMINHAVSAQEIDQVIIEAYNSEYRDRLIQYARKIVELKDLEK